MKRILFLSSVLLATNALAQVPANEFKFQPKSFAADSIQLQMPPSNVLKLETSSSFTPGMTLTLNLSEKTKTDNTPRLMRITLDDEKEYTLPYTYQNVWAGKTIYKNPNKGGLNIVIKPLEPNNYAVNTVRRY